MNTLFTDAATEAVLTSLFEKMPLIGVCLDIQGNVVYVNPYFFTITGFAKEEILGKNWFTTVVPAPIQQTMTATHDELLQEGSNARFENPILTKSGETRLISWTNVVLNDANGKPAGTLSIGEDVTDLKRAEATLMESEEKFRVLSEIAQEGIVIHDNGKILLCNQKFADMGNYKLSDVIGNSVMAFLPPESQEIVKKHMNDEQGGCYHVTGHRKDGTPVPVEICSKRIMYQGRNVRVATIREILKAEEIS